MLRIALPCLLGALATAPAAGDQQDPVAAQQAGLQKQYEELRRTRRDPLIREIHQRREALAKQADLANLRLLADKAQTAYEAKVASDPAVAEARRAEQAAGKAAQQIIKTRLAANKDLQALGEQVQGLADMQQEAEAERRELYGRIQRVRQEIERGSAMIQAREAVAAAEQAYRDLPKRLAPVAAAREAVAAARKALDEKIETLPEKRALDEALKQYSEIMRTSPELAKARQARDEARRAYEAQLDQAVRSDPKGAEAHAKLGELDQRRTDARKHHAELRRDLQEMERDLRKQDPVIRKAEEDMARARRAYQEAVSARTNDERKALEAARGEYDRKLREKVASDVMIQQRQEQLAKVDQQLRRIYEQIRELRRKQRGG
jgi:hypothetical protein